LRATLRLQAAARVAAAPAGRPPGGTVLKARPALWLAGCSVACGLSPVRRPRIGPLSVQRPGQMCTGVCQNPCLRIRHRGRATPLRGCRRHLIDSDVPRTFGRVAMTCTGHNLGDEAKYGEILGLGPYGVPAYSCDYDSARGNGWWSRPVGVECFGAPWQCVEYARRWLIKATGHAFDDGALADSCTMS
jgi:hypothetical protein